MQGASGEGNEAFYKEKGGGGAKNILCSVQVFCGSFGLKCVLRLSQCHPDPTVHKQREGGAKTYFAKLSSLWGSQPTTFGILNCHLTKIPPDEILGGVVQNCQALQLKGESIDHATFQGWTSTSLPKQLHNH